MSKLCQPYLAKIKTFESALAALSNDQLRARTTFFKDKIKQARAEKDSKITALKLEAEKH